MGTESTYTIEGSVIGGLWWPMGAPATKPVRFTFTRGAARPFTPHADTLLEAVDALTTAEGGDFSTLARLTADSVLVVEHRKAQRVTRRWFSLSGCASIADYMSDEYGFGEDD